MRAHTTPSLGLILAAQSPEVPGQLGQVTPRVPFILSVDFGVENGGLRDSGFKLFLQQQPGGGNHTQDHNHPSSL